MLSSLALRTTRRVAVQQMQRRNMAGGFPASFACRKNKYIEEWNGKREITERTFSLDYSDVPTFLIYIVLVPYGIYTWSRSEFINRKDDSRYDDLL